MNEMDIEIIKTELTGKLDTAVKQVRIYSLRATKEKKAPQKLLQEFKIL